MPFSLQENFKLYYSNTDLIEFSSQKIVWKLTVTICNLKDLYNDKLHLKVTLNIVAATVWYCIINNFRQLFKQTNVNVKLQVKDSVYSFYNQNFFQIKRIFCTALNI